MQLLARVRAALKLRDVQDRSDLLTNQLLSINAELERNLTARDSDLATRATLWCWPWQSSSSYATPRPARTCCASSATAASWRRRQRSEPALADRIDENFVRMLECCAPLHDIGKVSLPDHILLKPGKLTADERILDANTHHRRRGDVAGGGAQHGGALAFLQMGIDICRHHHERFDGNGYPDRLAGNAIPLAARLVSLADVYDALRSRRVYKPALSHSATMQIMLEGSEGQFDPALLPVFRRCAKQIDTVFNELAD